MGLLKPGKTDNFLTVLASHIDRDLSAEAVRRVLEQGKNSMLLTESVCPYKVHLHLSLERDEELKLELAPTYVFLMLPMCIEQC